MNENWKPIPGLEGRYEVSDQGRVRSYVSLGCRPGRRDAAVLLKPSTSSNGYLVVSLGRGRRRYVHHLVLEAFVGPRPDGMHACHANDDGLDARLDNLSYQTPRSNAYQRTLHGTSNRGTKNGHARLRERDVRKIRELAGQLSSSEMGRHYGVARQTIRDVIAGRTWQHVV